jgi:hypothetical protein
VSSCGESAQQSWGRVLALGIVVIVSGASEEIEDSLRRLRADKIDRYQVLMPDLETR